MSDIFIQEKGWIIEKLAKKMPEEIFHIIGGHYSDVEYWKSQTGVNVVYHGFITPEKLFNYYKKIDLALAPFQETIKIKGKIDIGRFTSPLKIFEYMSYSKMILCSDIPVLHEVLKDDETAIFLPHNDIAAWKSKIEFLAQNSKKARRIGENARKEFLSSHTWNIRAKKIIEFMYKKRS